MRLSCWYLLLQYLLSPVLETWSAVWLYTWGSLLQLSSKKRAMLLCPWVHSSVVYLRSSWYFWIKLSVKKIPYVLSPETKNIITLSFSLCGHVECVCTWYTLNVFFLSFRSCLLGRQIPNGKQRIQCSKGSLMLFLLSRWIVTQFLFFQFKWNVYCSEVTIFVLTSNFSGHFSLSIIYIFSNYPFQKW